ncbi:hypothetical protein N752_01535 [Desulforamulus aquiferis]|nr:hypothetical protein N752_01535 [Desulforamulus aquiferis]
MANLENLLNKKIAACITRKEDFPEALSHPNIKVIFALKGSINYLPSLIKSLLKRANFSLFIWICLRASVKTRREFTSWPGWA